MEKTKRFKGKVVLITFHRRENQNDNLIQLISAVRKLAETYSDTNFVWTLHPNPKIKNLVKKSELINYKNIILVPPLEYIDILKLMNLSKIILSDSGGIQEEAPSFGVPVIILRKITERPEGVDAKKAFLIQEFTTKKIQSLFENITTNFKTNNFDNPYGVGKAAQKIMNL